MKNNKILIIISVILLNVLVLFMIGQSFLGKASDYDIALSEARAFAKQELCSKAIDRYNDALSIEDSLDVRIEMLDVYEKGLNIGEFTNAYEVFGAVEEITEKYRDDSKAYENACDFLLKNGKYEECAQALMQARDLNVTSDKIEELCKNVRYKYDKKYKMYETLLPCYDGYYTASSDNAYVHLDEEAAPYSDGSYSYLSSFSEGYAFAKSIYPDGSEKSFIINEDEQRQVYLADVEMSSGIGAGQNKKGDTILLLSCKVGEKYKYYDINGKEVFGNYKFAGRFRNNIAAVQESEGKWKLIDGTGKAIVNKTFTDIILNEFDECAPKGIIIANDGDGYHLYNHKGKQIGDFSCDDAKAFVDSYAAFKKGDKWGFVDTNGKIIIEAQYDDAKSFSNELGAVKIVDAWSFISPENEVVVEETFEDVDYLNDKGVCFVMTDGYWSNLEFYYNGK